MPKIYLFVNSRSGPDNGLVRHVEHGGDFHVLAIAEDGHCLAGHLSSSTEWAKHDIGLTSKWKHELYEAHYPDGYELEWVDDPKEHAAIQAAFILNQALADA